MLFTLTELFLCYFVRIQLYVTLVSLAVFIGLIPAIIIGVCYAIIVSVVCRQVALLTSKPRVRWSSTGSSQRPLSRASSQARRYPPRSGVCADWWQVRLWRHRGIAAVNGSEWGPGYANKMLGRASCAVNSNSNTSKYLTPDFYIPTIAIPVKKCHRPLAISLTIAHCIGYQLGFI